jgi:hypothetical protein
VDDLGAALAEIGALGDTALVPPAAVNDTSSFAWFRDPSGNTVGQLGATGPVAAPLRGRPGRRGILDDRPPVCQKEMP